MKKNTIFAILAIALGLFLFAQKSAAATADHLVISQVQTTGGAGQTSHDFIELYNPTNQDIDLSGMKLAKWTKTGTTETSLITWANSDAIRTIKAHGYYLWANGDYASIAVSPDATRKNTVSPDNGVVLKDAAGNIIDAVAWGQPEHAVIEGVAISNFDDKSANMSIERKPGSGQGNGEDTGDNSADFFLQTAPHPRNSGSAVEPAITATPVSGTPSSSPPIPAPGGAGGETSANPPAFNLQITEIMPNPKGTDSGAEWVEFYNPGSAAFDLAGWILDDDGMEPLPGSGYYVIAGPATVPAYGYLAITIAKGSFALNNSGDEAIRLFDSGKALRLRQGFVGPAKEGQSFALQISGQWAWGPSPTPGAANIAAAAAPAAIVALKISEALPNPPGDDLEGEFIELYNYGDDSVELSGWAVADARKRYEILSEDFEDTEIPPHSYFALYRETTGISLNNTGEEQVKLFDPSGSLVDKVVFDAGSFGERSYAAQTGSAWHWTITATPGKENIILNIEKEETKAPRTEAPAPQETEKEAPEIKQAALSEIRDLPLGTVIATSGVIVVEPGILGKQVTYLAGSGVRLFLPADFDLLLVPGMEIAVMGEVAQFHSEYQLKIPAGSKIDVLSEGAEVKPHEIATGEVGETTEGFLVSMSGNITAQSGDTFYIDDGSGEARILIADSTGILKPQAKKGDLVSVTGIVTQWDDVYRVMPRYQSDLGFGAVAGERTLPRTGVDFWLTFAILSMGVIISKRIINQQKNEQS